MIISPPGTTSFKFQILPILDAMRLHNGWEVAGLTWKTMNINGFEKEESFKSLGALQSRLSSYRYFSELTTLNSSKEMKSNRKQPFSEQKRVK